MTTVDSEESLAIPTALQSQRRRKIQTSHSKPYEAAKISLLTYLTSAI